MADAAAAGKVSLARLIRFSTGAFASSGVVFALSIHVPRYFATHVGIGLAAVGLAFTVVRLIDIGVDPVLGLLMDRTQTSFGRYRVWFLLGTPILMASSYMLFMAAPGAGVGYLIVWLLVLYLAISMTGLAQAAWAGVLSGDYSERARIFGALGAVGVAGSAAVMLVPSVVTHWRPHDDIFALHAMGWSMIAALPVCAVLTAWTPEQLRTATAHERPTLQEYFRILWRPTMRRLVLADLALALGPGTLTPIFVFYWHDARLVSLANTNVMLVMFMIGGLVGAPIWGAVAGRIGKDRAVIASAVTFAIGQCVVVSLPRGSPFVFAGMFGVGFLISAFTLLTRAIMADVADEVRLDYGRERSGLLYAFISTTQKVGGAVSISLSFWLLAWLGYDPAAGVRNSAEHLRGLELVYAIAPITFILLGGALFIRFPLNAARHAEILAQLAERETPRASAAEAIADVAAGAGEIIAGVP